MRYGSANRTVFSAKYHVVFCPKYRRKVLVGRVEARSKEIIGGVCDGLRATVIELEVMPDHVHLLVGILPAVPLSRFVQAIKGRSSRRLRQEFGHLRWLPALWSPSWFISMVGGALLHVVRRYAGNQKAAA